MQSSACRTTLVGTIFAVAFAVGAPQTSATPNEAGTIQAFVGDARDAHGVTRIREDQRLTELARRQAVRMRDAGRIFHNESLPDELRKMTNAWSIVGENVGEGPTVEKIDAAFMASPTHKENILEPRYNAIGVAVEQNADGRRYVAQIFARFDEAAKVASSKVTASAKPASAPTVRTAAPQPQRRFVPVAYFPTACAGAPLEDGASFYSC